MVDNDNVSVIIPVYNDQTGLDSCLAALAVQTYPRDHYEVIVVDNASNPRIKLRPAFSHFARLVVCLAPGSYAARNAGIAAAHGEVLAFTDADCNPDKDWISAGVAALESEEGRCIVGGEVALALSEEPTAVERYQYLVGFSQRKNIEDRGFTATANLFATKDQIEEIGLFHESLLSGGDREWCWRAAKLGFAVKYVPRAIVNTTPRKSLSSAFRQARRVAGGRLSLGASESLCPDSSRLRPLRTPWQSIRWILGHPDLTVFQRLGVLWVAVLLKAAHSLEQLRVRLGGLPERQ